MKKEKIPLFVMTQRYRIEGEFHLLPGGKLLEQFHREKDFIPLTQVKVFDLEKNHHVDTVEFLAINKQSIIFWAPLSPQGID